MARKAPPRATPAPKRSRSSDIRRFLGFSLRGGTNVNNNTTVSQAQVKAQVEVWPCEELIKDRKKLVRAIARYLIKYPSVGTIRLARDLLPCAGNPVDAFLKYIKPVLLALRKMGLVELAIDDPMVGFAVVNLNLPNLIAKVRGGGDGSGHQG